ncbi:MAG: hypothetical protein AAFV26_00610 [Pseudomonadota bacterium]
MDDLLKIGAAVLGLAVMVLWMSHAGSAVAREDIVAEFKLDEREGKFLDVCIAMTERLSKSLRVVRDGNQRDVIAEVGCGCISKEVGKRVKAGSLLPAAAVLDLTAARRSIRFSGPTVQDRIYTTVGSAVSRYQITHEQFNAAEKPVGDALEVCTDPRRYDGLSLAGT